MTTTEQIASLYIQEREAALLKDYRRAAELAKRRLALMAERQARGFRQRVA